MVTDSNGAWWISIAQGTYASSNVGIVPGTTPPLVGGVAVTMWAPAPTAGSWAWAIITVVDSSSEVHMTLQTNPVDMALQSANGTTMSLVQLGTYGATTAYPACGTYHEGRLWLSGAVSNRIDSSMSNGVFTDEIQMSPTDANGNVFDNHGISETLNADELNAIFWMQPNDGRIVLGTLGGEWVLEASQLNDPITPTSIQIHRRTKYGCANIEPVMVGMATIFAQKLGRRVIEYVADAFSGKFTGRHLNQYAKHLTSAGIAEIKYQEEAFPCVWVRMKNGLLAGCTYRRIARFVTEAPVFNAWHWHVHGGLRVFTGLAVIPSNDGLVDKVFVVTNDGQTNWVNGTAQPGPAFLNNYYIEVLNPLFENDSTLLDGRFVDQTPGIGPGTSASDCAGGNASPFFPTGGPVGGDTVVPDVSTTAGPFTTYPTAGNQPGTGYGSSPPGAVFFDGNTALYNLPTVSADKAALSVSFWIGTTDVPGSAGALLSSPALSGAEAGHANKVISGIMGGRPTDPGNPNYPNDMAGFGFSGNGIGGGSSTYAYADNIDWSTASAGGLHWQHVMISLEYKASNSVEITAAVNDTVIFSAQTIASNTSG